MKNVKIIFKTYKCNISDYEIHNPQKRAKKRKYEEFSINISVKNT